MSRLVTFSSWVGRKLTITNALLVGGALLLSQGFYMDAKAKLAQALIEYSWQQRAAGSPPPKPWWWADTKAVALLEVPRLDKQVYVMQDDSGESLAFGPGHMTASAPIAGQGHVMIAGHRDSHFEFLRDVKVGDVIDTTKFDTSTIRYRVKEVLVLDSSKQDLSLYEHDELTLITCYPFDDVIPGGSLRYIVNAEPVRL